MMIQDFYMEDVINRKSIMINANNITWYSLDQNPLSKITVLFHVQPIKKSHILLVSFNELIEHFGLMFVCGLSTSGISSFYSLANFNSDFIFTTMTSKNLHLWVCFDCIFPFHLQVCSKLSYFSPFFDLDRSLKWVKIF